MANAGGRRHQRRVDDRNHRNFVIDGWQMPIKTMQLCYVKRSDEYCSKKKVHMKRHAVTIEANFDVTRNARHGTGSTDTAF